MKRPGSSLCVWGAIVALVLVAVPGVSQTPGAGDDAPARDGSTVTVAGPVYIARIRFDVIGTSRETALRAVSGIQELVWFNDADALDVHLERARQQLENRRVFDSVAVRWAEIPTVNADGGESPNGSSGDSAYPMTVPAPPREAPEGAIPVMVTFKVDDGWTLLPIPFYRYNSNTGHNPLGVLYWDNIGGTLTDFSMTTGYYSRNWVTPFIWDIRLDWERVRLFGRQWNFSLDHVFRTREKAGPEGDLLFAYSGYETGVGVSTGFSLFRGVSYSVSTSVASKYAYDVLRNVTGEPEPKAATSVGVSHGVGYGRIDWSKNTRAGWSVSLSNSLGWNVGAGDPSAGISASAVWFGQYGPLNPGVRAQLSHSFDGDKLEQGGGVRGVANNRVFGQTTATLNTQLGFVGIWIPGFAEFQFVPFTDWIVARKEGQSLSWDDVSGGAGFDLLAFPEFLRGFQGRLSVGIDLLHPPSDPLDLNSLEIEIVETFHF